jgi:hypothetical protein
MLLTKKLENAKVSISLAKVQATNDERYKKSKIRII